MIFEVRPDSQDEYAQGRTQRGLPGCSLPSPPPPPNPNLKNTDYVEAKISSVLRDLPISRDQPLKSADDQYTGSLKIKQKNYDFLNEIK
jgi:hypothetical protein